MNPNPTAKVLSTILKHQVKALLMGGQACVFYGAAEFSRDSDFVILADPENLTRLQGLLQELEAEVIAVPPFDIQHLLKGHAIHFRCRHLEVAGFRIDIMSVLRGVDPFPELWMRRTTLSIPELGDVELLSLRDLVAAKKTQRDKDWPMIRRLIEADYFQHHLNPSQEQLSFWLEEALTPEILISLAEAYPEKTQRLAAHRELLIHSLSGDESNLIAALEDERRKEQQKDRLYWQPLRKELEALRHNRIAARPYTPPTPPL